MRIYGKLVFGLGGAMLALSAALAVVLFQAAALLDLKNYSSDASRLVALWDDVQIASQSLVLAPEGVSSLRDKWKAANSDFDKALAEFAKDKRAAGLDADTRQLAATAPVVWKMTKSQIASAEEALDDFLAKVASKHASLMNGNDGLMAEFYRLERDKAFEYVESSYFVSFRSALRSIMLSNDAFKNLLKRVDQGAGKAVATRVRLVYALGLLICAVLVAGALAYLHLFSKRLSLRARRIEDSMKAVAHRDFSRSLVENGKDELGSLSRYLSETTAALGGFLRSVHGAVENVTELKDALSAGTAQSAASVHQITAGIQSITQRFVVLDEHIHAATAALDEIGDYLASFKKETEFQASAMERAGAELAATVSAVGGVARGLAEKAQNAEQLKRVVLEGGDRVQTTNTLIRSIAKDIQGIQEIIELIDQISEQTNILSMNAAIESAHAGGAGKGFAVVSEEIRKLAETTQDHAQRIGSSLKAITDMAGTALEASETTARSFDSINADVVGFVSALEDIAGQAQKADSEARAVAEAIHDSAAASLRVNEGTSEVYDRHRAVRAAMASIKSISDETVSGIRDIDLGSREILESVRGVDAISARSRERVAELEEAMKLFKVSEEEGAEVAVKEAPETVEEALGSGTAAFGEGLRAEAGEAASPTPSR